LIAFFRVVWEFARKDFRVLKSYRLSFLTGILATVYGIVSFRYVSRLIGGNKYIADSTEYFRFVVVGFVVAGVLRASTITTATNARRDQVEGTLEILATQPISLLALALGWGILPVLEEIVAAMITLGIAVPLGFQGVSPNWPATFVCLVVSAILFTAIGFIAAAAVLAIQQGVALAAVVTAIMTLVSGAAFPIAVMPMWLQFFAKLSPLYYALTATRTAILNGGDESQVALHILVLVGITVVLLPVGLVILRMALNYARSRGSLARF
jgi:ABC-2 type transport system permease protein